jgi:hypothetical protein
LKGGGIAAKWYGVAEEVDDERVGEWVDEVQQRDNMLCRR